MKGNHGAKPGPRIHRFGFIVLVVLAGAVAGCRQALPRADLVICNGVEPESLDPAAVTGQADLRVVGALYEGLTRLNPTNAMPEPGLAERWVTSEDDRVYTFTLRSNVVWSTGQPITARDVVFSWRRVVDPATASDYAGLLYFVKNGAAINSGKITDLAALGVAAPDERTVRVTLEAPTPFFLDLCALRTLAVVPEHIIAEHGDDWLKVRPLPVSGAYALEFWRIHDRIRVRKNPRYWDAPNVRSDTIDFLPVTSPSAALNLYSTGAADIIWDKDLIPTEVLDVMLTRPDVHTFQYLGTYFIRVNITRKPFDDLRVRRALAMAVDKERILKRIVRIGTVATHFTPRGVARYDPPAGLGYDPEAARRLLAEAGYPGGAGFPTFRYLFNSSRVHELIGVELQEMWRQNLGINVELRQAEWQVYLAAQTALDYDTCRASWIGDYNDANTFLDCFLSTSGNNRTGWTNAVYDRLIQSANQSRDPQQRAAYFLEAETLLVREQLPIIPLYFYAGMNIYDPQRISGIHTNILDEHPVHVIQRN